MKTYIVLFAEDVPHYGTVEIEAADDNAALEAAMAYDFSEVTTDPEWENSGCRRIVHIKDADENFLHEDIPLDNLFVRYGGEKERVLCDAAPQLLKALEMCERAIKEATDIMHYEGGQPVTALEGYEIQRAYVALSSVLGEVHQAITAARGGQP
jgi:hypothetical protein